MSSERFVAHGRTMRALVEQVPRLASIDSNVLISGETGTGKNAVARELHARGAFTDAIAARPGRFELAANGTVYQDAVTELSIEAQGQAAADRRGEAGGTARRPDVARRGGAGRGVGRLARRRCGPRGTVPRRPVPPHRRPPDPDPAAQGTARRYRAARQALSRPRVLGRGTGDAGNVVREILDGQALRPEDTAGRRPTLAEVERRYIAATLQHARGNQTRAAELLGISRKALWEKRKRYGLN